MSFSYGLGANPPIDYPRLLIADTDSAHPIFQDEEILAVTQIVTIPVWAEITPSGAPGVSYAQPSYRFIAAALLEALASNKSRLAAVTEVLDIHMAVEKAAQELRATAKAMRDAENNSGIFAIAELVYDQFTARQRLWKQLIRLYSG